MKTKYEFLKEFDKEAVTSHNEYLFLEVLVDIRDQLDKIRDQLTRTI